MAAKKKDQHPPKLPELVGSAQLRKLSQEVVDLVASPEFMKHVQAVFAAEESVRLTEAANRLTPTALRNAGLPIPEWTKISSRYFEEGMPDEVKFTDTEAGKDILQILHEREPGILDRIRREDEDLWGRLTIKKPFFLDPIGPRAGLCVCAGGGPGWSVCVGAGV